jgi:hypothetical protein
MLRRDDRHLLLPLAMPSLRDHSRQIFWGAGMTDKNRRSPALTVSQKALQRAKEIAAHGDNTTYPSGAAARHVRSILIALVDMLDWRSSETAPQDGAHIAVCTGPFGTHFGFNQRPPVVVHYFNDGFYMSSGIVAGSYNDEPVQFTHWRPLGAEPLTAYQRPEENP